MIGRILRSVDFERVLGTPIRARSAHFAVHYLAGVPSKAAKPRSKSVAAASGMGCSVSEADGQVSSQPAAAALSSAKLSTGVSETVSTLVDESVPAGIWVGYVVPKRHARRAVTRTLLKHQIQHAVTVQAAVPPSAGLADGLWVVRLRSPFDRKTYPSASSDALRHAAAEELHAVMADAARRVAR